VSLVTAGKIELSSGNIKLNRATPTIKVKTRDRIKIKIVRPFIGYFILSSLSRRGLGCFEKINFYPRRVSHFFAAVGVCSPTAFAWGHLYFSRR